MDGLQVQSVGRAVNAPDFDRRVLLQFLLWLVRGGSTDLAIGVYVWNDAVVRWLLPELRRRGFGGRIVLGGPQISYSPSGIAETYPEADALIRGYGEDALVRVLASPAGTPIPGVVWRHGPDLAQTAQVDLAQLPSPVLTRLLPVQSFMRWETQRGCIYTCSFCQHREAGARLQQRTLGPGRINQEIEALVRGGAQDIAVLDPIFNSNPDACAILRRFAELGYTGRLSLQARFEMLTDAFLDACQGLNVLLEFGLQTVHHSEMKAVRRMNDMAKVHAAIERQHRRGCRSRCR